MPEIDDALDAMSARDLERLQGKIERRLRACAIDGNDGAVACRVTAPTSRGHAVFSLLLCPACIERHRLPEGRSEDQA